MMVTTNVQIALCAVQIWERLLLTFGEGANQGVYSCRVVDIKSDRLVISRPVFEYGNTLLADNRIVTASFTRSDAAYSFSARLKETDPKSPDEMYLLHPGVVERIQRRRFVRLDLNTAIGCAVLPRPLTESVDLHRLEFHPSLTINISAAGTLLPVPSVVSAGSIVVLNTDDERLTRMPPYILAVCRQHRLLEHGRFVAGCEFILKAYLDRYLTASELACLPDELTGFDFRAQNELAGELFAQQVILRRKGLL